MTRFQYLHYMKIISFISPSVFNIINIIIIINISFMWMSFEAWDNQRKIVYGNQQLNPQFLTLGKWWKPQKKKKWIIENNSNSYDICEYSAMDILYLRVSQCIFLVGLNFKKFWNYHWNLLRGLRDKTVNSILPASVDSTIFNITAK